MPPALDRIDHVHVFVTDRVKAEPWYREVFNLQRETELEFWASDGDPLMLKNPSGTIMLAVFERFPQPSRSTVAFQIGASQFLEWILHLEQVTGLKVDVVDHDVSWSIYFQDPYDNPYEITCYEYNALTRELRQRV